MSDDKKSDNISILFIFIVVISILLSFVFDGIDNDLPPLQNTIDDSPFESKGFESNGFEEEHY